MKLTTLIAACIASAFAASDGYGQKGKVPIRHSPPLKGGKGLGTTGYVPLGDESPFQKKITEKSIKLWPTVKFPKPPNMSEEDWKEMEQQWIEEEKNSIPVAEYELSKQAGEYVGWFGIVRAVEFDELAGQSNIRVEHKYFDGLTDLHLHIVSIFGAGDFQIVVPGKVTTKQVPPLSLICAYGIVGEGEEPGPKLKAEYIRLWDWGRFTFMDYGQDKTRAEWKKLRKVEPQKIYEPRPTTKFYQERIGKR